LQWVGEKEQSDFANKSLIPGILPALIFMILIILLLFNSIKSTFIIFFTIPFSFIGIATAMLLFDSKFGFLALLGAMSLSGMIIKNSIVLIDQIQQNEKDNLELLSAVVSAAKLRLRPVLLASITTVLGVVPLLQDEFWSAMGITIMGGLIIGTVVSMVLVPVMYVLFTVKKCEV
ncbi:MAG: efflux RND transporter permease subunit, partial [Lentisphaeria bacterium]